MSLLHSTIAELNDVLRTTFLTGKIVLTEGITALDPHLESAVITAVREFTAFHPGDDPYGEHDFRAVTVRDVGLAFGKIDYYDPTGTCGSEDPSDPKRTLRVLTIMLADEY